MTSLRRMGLVLLATVTAACSFTPVANAERGPTAPKPGTGPDRLIAKDLNEDAEVARAIREFYTKYEYRIPMRDGVRLFTAVYVPKNTSRRFPILMMRTPYGVGPYGVDNYPEQENGRALRRFAPSLDLLQQGFIFVHQDVRGRMMSEGTFVDVRPFVPTKKGRTEVDESSDAYDTIDFLVQNIPNNNGRVGIWGISYPGFYAAQAAIDAHPALKAVSPQAPVTDWFVGDDFHHNGAFFLADAFDFFASFGKPRPEPTPKQSSDFDYQKGDLYEFFLRMGPLKNANEKWLKGEIAFWNDLMTHDTLDDFWKARNPRPHYRNSSAAILTVGGLYDAEDLFGALETYRSFERQSKGKANFLVMGPWRHGGWARSDGEGLGDMTFGAKTSKYYRQHVEAPFFMEHLYGSASANLGEVTVFETSTNQWRSYPSWPPPEAKPVTLWFHKNGRLSAASPVEEVQAPRRSGTISVAPASFPNPPTNVTASLGLSQAVGFDAFVSDPNRPVPYQGTYSVERGAEYMLDDQRFASRRPDVLTYETEALTDDVALVGPLEASLWVSTTGTDADFIVKLVDVFSDNAVSPEHKRDVRLAGYQHLVRAEVMRGKFRNSLEKPEPFVPNQPTLVRFTLPDVHHTFRSGHRLMVQVQSTWFPLVDRNPQIFVKIPDARDSDFQVQTHKVYRDKDHLSGIKVLLLRGTAPK